MPNETIEDGGVSAFFGSVFGREAEVCARAPGRVEFIGNHVDYNGGEVLGAAIDRYVWVAVARRDDDRIRLRSMAGNAIYETKTESISPASGSDSWVNYPLGVFNVLRSKGLRAERGFDLAVASDLPSGAGLSSSAAFELSTAFALKEAYSFELGLKETVLAAQQAENEFVGVPCGVLDQAVSGYGEVNHLVHLDCRAQDFRAVAIPEGVHLWIFNTNKKHSLVDSMYSKRHAECREALRLMQDSGVTVEVLVDVTPEQLEGARDRLPENVFKRAKHVIEEHSRVRACMQHLAESDLKAVGQRLFESHWSSSRYFENSIQELDTLVDLLAGREGVYGARLSGGGFGGAVMAMTTRAFDEASAREVAAVYRERLSDAPELSIFHVRPGAGASLI